MEKSHPRMLKNNGGSSSAKANEVLERLRNKKNGKKEEIVEEPTKESPLDKLRRKKKEKKGTETKVLVKEGDDLVEKEIESGSEVDISTPGKVVVTEKIKVKSKTMEKVKADNTTCHFYMGCFPLLCDYQLFSEILKPYIVKVEKENKTESIHLIPFNEGIKSLARFKKDIYADCRKWEHILVDTFDQVFHFLPTNKDRDRIIRSL